MSTFKLYKTCKVQNTEYLKCINCVKIGHSLLLLFQTEQNEGYFKTQIKQLVGPLG